MRRAKAQDGFHPFKEEADRNSSCDGTMAHGYAHPLASQFSKNDTPSNLYHEKGRLTMTSRRLSDVDSRRAPTRKLKLLAKIEDTDLRAAYPQLTTF